MERKGKQLLPTKDGDNLVCVLPDSLTSPQLTAAWENNLTQIAKGNADPDTFMQGIETMAQELVKTYASVLGEKQELFKTEKTELGKCPRCKSPVYEGKKNYYCSNKECSFAMWKNDRFFEEWKTVFTPKIAAALLKSGKATVKKLYSPKTGKTYDGTVLLADRAVVCELQSSHFKGQRTGIASIGAVHHFRKSPLSSADDCGGFFLLGSFPNPLHFFKSLAEQAARCI